MTNSLDSGPIYVETWFVVKWIKNNRERAKIEAFAQCLISSSTSSSL